MNFADSQPAATTEAQSLPEAPSRDFFTISPTNFHKPARKRALGASALISRAIHESSTSPQSPKSGAPALAPSENFPLTTKSVLRIGWAMSRSANKPAIGVEWAEWQVGEPLLPQEKAELLRLCSIQKQAEKAKEALVFQAMLRVVTQNQTRPERN